MSRLSIELRVPLEDFPLEFRHDSDSHSLGIFGPSGSGKTTVLEAVAGWREAEVGYVRVGARTLLDTQKGVSMPLAERGIGYVPQDVLLFPHWTVERNALAGARRNGGAADGGRFERVFAVLELEALRDRSVDSLSGGERQRVALARALCSGPELLLLDEPLGSLDLPLRRRILPYLLRAREEFGVPMLLVSHDATEVQVLCDEVVVLERGRVRARGEPGEVFARLEHGPIGDSPSGRGQADRFENVLRGTVLAVGAGTARIELAPGISLTVPRCGLVPGERAVVGLLADDILIATTRPSGLSARNILDATVLDIAPAGDDVRVLAAIGQSASEPVVVRVQVTSAAARELALAPALPLFLVVKTHSCSVLAGLSHD